MGLFHGLGRYGPSDVNQTVGGERHDAVANSHENRLFGMVQAVRSSEGIRGQQHLDRRA